ncbi:hypothetical protein C2E23DRAFT_717420, partial [Lenzites betulinus]
MYGDRRFQTDRSYSYVAYSHSQVRASTTGGYLLTKKSNFVNVADKLLSIDREALDNLIKRADGGSFVAPETEAEKKCFELMNLIDHASGQVGGSAARKKHQRNEIKSLIFLKGVPSFFFTFAPADTKNPICLSYCGENIDLSQPSPRLRTDSERLRAVAGNPVGAARFFDRTVNALLRVMLGLGYNRNGLFGKTAAYYGTVE